MSPELQTATPKPHVARILEAVAAIMAVDTGRQRLELVFQDGRLTEWLSHDEANPAGDLERFDEQAAGLTQRLRLA